MHVLSDLSLLWTWCHSVSEFITLHSGFFCEVTREDLDKLLLPQKSAPSTSELTNWNTLLELILSVVCFLFSIFLFCYYSYDHYKMRAEFKSPRYRQTAWTKDQVNACLIPLALAIVFAILYYMQR